VPNPNPNLKNLTNAGKGRPRKGRSTVKVTLPPPLLDRIDEVAKLQDWDRSYTIEQMCRLVLDFGPDYDEGDFDLIRRGLGGE
jgi:hypothetical protein